MLKDDLVKWIWPTGVKDNPQNYLNSRGEEKVGGRAGWEIPVDLDCNNQHLFNVTWSNKRILCYDKLPELWLAKQQAYQSY